MSTRQTDITYDGKRFWWRGRGQEISRLPQILFFGHIMLLTGDVSANLSLNAGIGLALPLFFARIIVILPDNWLMRWL